ncbi:MAG: PDZ domain-containing protein [Acidobacteriota bacterium]|jgi:signal transduction histidine kinase|nr:PDZ domain-containing protein [Acidobacteriota bacterium]
MNRFPATLRLVATALLTFALLAAGVLNLRDRVAWTDASDGVFWTEAEDQATGLVATEVVQDGAGYAAGIREGDRLLGIEGEPVPNLAAYAECLYAAGPGALVRYEVATAAGVRSLPVSLSARHLFTVRDGLKTLLAFLHLGIGAFVFLRGRRLPLARHFYLLCLTAFALWLFSYTPALGLLDLFAYAVSVAAFLLLPAAFLHFCLRFPDARPRPAAVAAPYLASGLLLAAHLLWVTGHLAPLGVARTVAAGESLDRFELVWFCAAFLAGGVLLLRRHLGGAGAEDLLARQQMKWIAYGSLAGIVPFGLIYLLPTLLGAPARFARFSPAMDASMLFLALVPLSVGYAVLGFRLMDVEDIARKSAACLVSALALLFACILGALAFDGALRDLTPRAGALVAALAALAMALLFNPLRRAVQTGFDRAFYRNSFHDRRTLLDFARALSSEISLQPLTQRILDRVTRAFPVDGAALFLPDAAHPGWLRCAQGVNHDGCGSILLAPASTGSTGEASGDPGRAAAGELPGLKGGAGCLRPADGGLARAGFAYRQDLLSQGRCVGVLALGALPPSRHFSGADVELLAALAGYAAVALENATLYRSVEAKAEEVARLKDYTENILESIDVAVLSVTASGRVRSCNRAFEELYAASRRDIAGALAENLLSADVVAALRNAAGMDGWSPDAPAGIFKLALKNSDGRRLVVNLGVRPFDYGDGALQEGEVAAHSRRGCLLVMEDVTEKTRLEAQLLQAEKLSSVGLLAAGVAHEINTPLTGISSYTQMLLKGDVEAGRRKALLEKIERQTFRAAEIVGNLLNFSRLGGDEFAAVDINRVIHDSLSLLDHQLDRKRIRVASDLGERLAPVYGNTGKLQQVFVNLFLNARDAMPAGGEIAIRTGMDESMVVVDVSDTGGGIPQENLQRIFDPFFTTKGVGRGTGLGLAVSYGIIQEHGGGIFVESDAGKGTRFTLRLPARLN